VSKKQPCNDNNSADRVFCAVFNTNLGCSLYSVARSRKRSKKTDEGEVDESLEDNYEKLLGKRNSVNAASKFDTKPLLPTKCKEMGVVRRSIQVPKKAGLLCYLFF